MFGLNAESMIPISTKNHIKISIFFFPNFKIDTHFRTSHKKKSYRA